MNHSIYTPLCDITSDIDSPVADPTISNSPPYYVLLFSLILLSGLFLLGMLCLRWQRRQFLPVSLSHCLSSRRGSYQLEEVEMTVM